MPLLGSAINSDVSAAPAASNAPHPLEPPPPYLSFKLSQDDSRPLEECVTECLEALGGKSGFVNTVKQDSTVAQQMLGHILTMSKSQNWSVFQDRRREVNLGWIKEVSIPFQSGSEKRKALQKLYAICSSHPNHFDRGSLTVRDQELFFDQTGSKPSKASSMAVYLTKKLLENITKQVPEPAEIAATALLQSSPCSCPTVGSLGANQRDNDSDQNAS